MMIRFFSFLLLLGLRFALWPSKTTHLLLLLLIHLIIYLYFLLLLVLLPHIGSASYETRLQMAKLTAHNVLACLEGCEPPGLVV